MSNVQDSDMNPDIVPDEKAGWFWSPPNLLSLSRIVAVPIIYWGFARD